MLRLPPVHLRFRCVLGASCACARFRAGRPAPSRRRSAAPAPRPPSPSPAVALAPRVQPFPLPFPVPRAAPRTPRCRPLPGPARPVSRPVFVAYLLPRAGPRLQSSAQMAVRPNPNQVKSAHYLSQPNCKLFTLSISKAILFCDPVRSNIDCDR